MIGKIASLTSPFLGLLRIADPRGSRLREAMRESFAGARCSAFADG
jgi:hypothetical protein